MRRRTFYFYLFVCLCFASLTTRSTAQTITTGPITPSSLCSSGGTITINYTITGTFSATNTFSAQVSDATGAFSASPTVIGSVSGASAVPINVTLPAIATGAYKIRVVSNSPARTGSTSDLAVTSAPSPPGTSAVSYCIGQSASALTAVAASGATLKWYGTNQTGGTASSGAPTPSTGAAGTTTYYVSQSIGSCESSRASIVVTVNNAPSAPGVASVSFCNNAPASQLAATGQNLKWYDAADKLLDAAPTPSTNAIGTQTFKVSQTVNGCEGPKASLTVTINALPAAPTGNTPSPYCQGTGATPLTATGQNLLWYGTNATGGNGSSAATTPSTAAPGQTTYYVTQTVNGCESPRAGIVVTVKPAPGAPGVSPVAFCQGSPPPTLTATSLSGGTLNWYGTNQTGGTASATAPTPSNTTPGTTTYYVSQTIDGCEGPRAAIAVTVNPTPVAPGVVPVSVCQNGSVTLNATPSAGGSLNWYGTSATGGTASANAPSVSTSAPSTSTYYVSQSINGCEGPRASINVTVNALPAAPGVTNLTYCLQTPDQPAQNVGALTAVGTGLKWYNVEGSPLNAAPVPSIGQAGVQTFKVSQTLNNCESPQATLQVTVGTTATPTVASPNLAYCQFQQSQPLQATAETGASLRWVIPGLPASTTAPTPHTNIPGNQTFSVYQIGQSGCYSQRASINITIKALPAPPVVTSVSFCNTSAASQLTANGQNLKWYDAADKLLDVAPTPATSATGTQTFRVSQTVESCEGPKATLTVTIKPLPAAPGIANLNYCLQTQDQAAQNVAPLTAYGENLRWFNSDGNQYPNAPTPIITQVGTQTYLVDQTYNGCTGPKATIQVTIRTTAAPTVARPLVTYCVNERAVALQATAETGASLRWIDPYDRVLTEAPIPSTLNTSIKPDGDPFYVFQIGQNGCYSERAVTKVIVNALPTLSLISPVTSINLGQRVALQLKFTSIPPFSYTLADGQAGVVNKTDTTLSLLPRSTTTYQVAAVRNSCGVGLPGSPATATITVRVPTVTTSALTATTLCAGTSISVPFTTTGEFNQGNQFRIELVSVADTSKKYAAPTSSTTSPVTSPLPLTLVGGQYYVRVKADNPEIAILGSNSPTQLTVYPKPSATLTGTQNIYEGYPASLTIALGGESPWTVTYADSVQSYSATATATPYTPEVRPTRTTIYRLVSVANACGTGTISGTATVTVLPLLAVEDDPLGPLVKTFPIPTTSVITVELNLPLTRNPATLSLTDLSGKPIIQQTSKNQKQELDLTAQPNGLYLLRIQVGDKQTVRKVIKQ